MTHYEALGILPKAPSEVIDASFKALAKIHHPDKGGNAAKFRRIKEAHAVLIDPSKRAAYDLTIEDAPRKRKKAKPVPTAEEPYETEPYGEPYRQPYQDPRAAVQHAAKQYAHSVVDDFLSGIFGGKR